MPKRVRIVCDGCGDDHGTDEIVSGLAEAGGVSIDQVHEDLWYDVGRSEEKRHIVLEGGHAVRLVP